MKNKSGFVPKPFRVFVSFVPDGKKEWHTQMLGRGYATVEEAEKAIAEEKRKMKEFDHTYAGLLPRYPESKKEYTVWHADWALTKVL